jgi:serine/threonine protein kinase
LDCKPSNILLYKNMLIKLIDFGESFHEEVCG